MAAAITPLFVIVIGRARARANPGSDGRASASADYRAGSRPNRRANAGAFKELLFSCLRIAVTPPVMLPERWN